MKLEAGHASSILADGGLSELFHKTSRHSRLIDLLVATTCYGRHYKTLSASGYIYGNSMDKLWDRYSVTQTRV